MTIWSLPESIAHLSFLVGALVLVPLCRRWIGGPPWTYGVAFLGLAIAAGGEIRRLVLLGMQPVGSPDPADWLIANVQAAGYLIVLVGFLIWVRHIRQSRMQLEAMTPIDPLTHLANRRPALLMLQHEIARARRQAAPLALLVIDLDGFKPINDEFGRLAGDAVLKHAARLLSRRARSSDIAARSGGNEFLLVLPDAGAPAAVQVAIDLRRLFNETPARFGRLEIPLQASFGVAGLEPGQALGPDDLLARAAEAVYFVKRTGGGGVADWQSLDVHFTTENTESAEKTASSR
jgi:diguanylate cyclase (GGDEF)-like protein